MVPRWLKESGETPRWDLILAIEWREIDLSGVKVEGKGVRGKTVPVVVAQVGVNRSPRAAAVPANRNMVVEGSYRGR